MAYTTQVNCPIYDGDGSPWKHWFVCEAVWEHNIVVDDSRQISMLIEGLRDRYLIWYMDLIENRQKKSTKQEEFLGIILDAR